MAYDFSSFAGVPRNKHAIVGVPIDIGILNRPYGPTKNYFLFILSENSI